MDKEKLKKSYRKALKSILSFLPIAVPLIMFISLITILIPNSFYTNLFSQNQILNSFIGAILGSISAGNSMLSYIISGELLKLNISLVAITAFIVSWTTVGIIQMPAEMKYLGKKFSITRNILSFISSIVVGILTVMIINLI